MQKRTFVRSALGLGLVSALPSLRAQPAFPSRPITFVVPFAAGGGGDAVARMIGKELSTRVGVPVVVENRAGAGGNIGAAYVLKAKPDGYTLLNMSSTYAIQAAVSKVPFDPIADMQPLLMVSRDPAIVLSVKGSPLRDAKSLVAAAKAKPGKITYGSAGVGSIAHLGMVELGLVLGIEMQHIPYKGTSLVYADLMAGSIDIMLTGTTFANPQIRGDRLQALGIAGEKRYPSLPEVPTFAEQGYPEYRVHDWKAIGGPKGMPDTLVAQLNRELNAALAMPSVSEKLTGEGSTVVGGTPEQMLQTIRSDIEHWKTVAQKANVQID
ncbi:MAG: tripartite tricarboxylate transporter substrate binding protein [Variovorax sp.]